MCCNDNIDRSFAVENFPKPAGNKYREIWGSRPLRYGCKLVLRDSLKERRQVVKFVRRLEDWVLYEQGGEMKMIEAYWFLQVN